MKKLLLSLPVALLLVSFIGVPASAKNDKRFPLIQPSLDLEDVFCGFPVHIDPVEQNVYASVSELPDGSFVTKFSGTLKLELTNLDTDQSITVNASGPGTITQNTDGSLLYDVRGTILWWLFPEDAEQFGLPGLFLFTGKFVDLIGADGSETVLAAKGHATDLCAALA